MNIGKYQQFLRFIFGLMIFLLLFSGGLSRPLSATASTTANANAAAIYNLKDDFGQTLGLTGNILKLGQGNIVHGLCCADYDLKIAARAGQASVAEFFDGIKNNVRDRLRNWLGIEDSPDDIEFLLLNNNDQSSVINDNDGNDQASMSDDNFEKESNLFEKEPDSSESAPVPIVQNIYQNIYPEKEIQTIHTKEVHIKTETIVVDKNTKDAVEHILRQLDSDRPNYSLGQVFLCRRTLTPKPYASGILRALTLPWIGTAMPELTI